MGALFILDYWHDAHGGRAGIESGAAFPAFEAYARVSAAHYRDRNVVFEIWNEPDVPERMTLTGARFAELVAAGVRGLRAGDPSARVITGGLSYVNLAYAQAMLPALSAAPSTTTYQSKAHWRSMISIRQSSLAPSEQAKPLASRSAATAERSRPA